MKAIRVRTSAPIVLFVGRLVGYKGVDVLLQAMKGLDAETVIVGDGRVSMSLMALASDLGISDRVRFVGDVSEAELQAWYHACDVLVLPSVSKQEAFGMVQLEAMLVWTSRGQHGAADRDVLGQSARTDWPCREGGRCLELHRRRVPIDRRPGVARPAW